MLKPNNLIGFEIKAKKKKWKKNKITLRFSWKDTPFSPSDLKSLEIHS